ncbi:MAG: hypothetical protein ACR2NY_00630 [Alphaproteobacteria bacterium]
MTDKNTTNIKPKKNIGKKMATAEPSGLTEKQKADIEFVVNDIYRRYPITMRKLADG